jgi:hypothetical protein
MTAKGVVGERVAEGPNKKPMNGDSNFDERKRCRNIGRKAGILLKR